MAASARSLLLSAIGLTLPWVVNAAATAATAAPTAQTVYRCGPAANQYSQQPCADGRAVDVSDPRSPAQAAEARAIVRSQQRLANDMERSRRAEEAAHRPIMAGGIGRRPAPDTVLAKAEKKPPKRPGARKPMVRPAVHVDDGSDFVAMAPGSGKKKKAQD